MPEPDRNLVFHRGAVTTDDRERLLGQRGCVVWMTGLSGSGKSTIAHALELRLMNRGRLVQVLDGDNLRLHLNSDLGFGAADRAENIRRVAAVAALSVELGVIVVTALISPFRADRARARQTIGASRFVEAFVDVPVGRCAKRDPKGLYRRARAGELQEFTGIDSPYEPPDRPDVRLPADELSVDACVDRLSHELDLRGFLTPPPPTTGRPR
jgi:adenylyl-sulfate kinase